MDDVPYAPAGIATLPSWLLGRAAARGHRLVAAALAEEGLRMMQHAVLATVAELGPVSQAALGRTLRVDPKDMAAIVAELHREGFVDRAPDPGDRRRNAVTISGRGRQVLLRTERLGARANDELTAALSPAERTQLVDLLARVATPPSAGSPSQAGSDRDGDRGRPRATLSRTGNAPGNTASKGTP